MKLVLHADLSQRNSARDGADRNEIATARERHENLKPPASRTQLHGFANVSRGLERTRCAYVPGTGVLMYS
jgi:hypothetical protein